MRHGKEKGKEIRSRVVGYGRLEIWGYLGRGGDNGFICGVVLNGGTPQRRVRSIKQRKGWDDYVPGCKCYISSHRQLVPARS